MHVSREKQIINEKYDFIQEIISEVLVNKSEKEEKTDKIDHWLTHRIWGFPIFLGIMALVFLLTFTLGDWLKEYLAMGIDALSSFVESSLEGAKVHPE